jgi:hypothetical protein
MHVMAPVHRPVDGDGVALHRDVDVARAVEHVRVDGRGHGRAARPGGAHVPVAGAVTAG